MGKKNLTNAHCLLDMIEKAPASTLRAFSGLPECQALARGFDWSQDESTLPPALVEHVKHLRKDQRDPAEREALRVLHLASPRGSAILANVAEQLNDSDLIAMFLSQDGGEIGRSVWMRTHSDDAARLFDVAESILNTDDLRGNKRLHDAFDVPCDEAPPFIWNDAVKKELETQLTSVCALANRACRCCAFCLSSQSARYAARRAVDHPCHPCAQSSCGWPTPGSAYRRSRNAPSTADLAGRLLPSLRQGTVRQPRVRAAGRGSWRTSSDPTPRHPSPARRTSGTACCSESAHRIRSRIMNTISTTFTTQSAFTCGRISTVRACYELKVLQHVDGACKPVSLIQAM